MPSEITLLAVVLIVFTAALVRSTIGFGDALIAMPLLAFIVDIKTATPLVAMICSTISPLILFRSWSSIDFRAARRLVMSSVIGIPIGILFLRTTYPSLVKAALALVIMGFSLMQISHLNLRIQKERNLSYLFGLFAGILGGAYNTSGPPIVMYGTMRRWSPVAFRATLQGYFLPTGLFVLMSHGISGLWTRSVLQYYLASLPLVIAAVFMGMRISHFIPAGRFDRLIHIALVVTGAFLLIQALGEGF